MMCGGDSSSRRYFTFVFDSSSVSVDDPPTTRTIIWAADGGRSSAPSFSAATAGVEVGVGGGEIRMSLSSREPDRDRDRDLAPSDRDFNRTGGGGVLDLDRLRDFSPDLAVVSLSLPPTDFLTLAAAALGLSSSDD